MIEAEQSCAVKRDIANKFDKGVLHPVEAAIMVEMFGIDIGDDRYGAVQAQETAVAFIGFHHHPVAGAKPGVGAVAVDDPARSEEHTSELQSLMRISYAVFCLKKKKKHKQIHKHTTLNK